MKKQNRLYPVLLGILLMLALTLAACQKQVSEETTGSTPTETTEAPSQTQEAGKTEKKDFFDKVFDTSEDAGRLTVRYLYTSTAFMMNGERVQCGDAVVYKSPEGKIMMVDCGNPAGFDEFDPQLQAMGIEKIDIFVMSHPHADHIGSFLKLAEKYPIGTVYYNGHEYASNTYQNAKAYVLEHNIPFILLKEGDSFKLGESVEVTVYNPEKGQTDDVSASYADANNGSIAMRVVYGDSSFWTAGDIYALAEERLIETYGDAIHCDIVKMNHHGNSTSNGKKFVEGMKPKAAIGLYEVIADKTVALRYSVKGALTFYNCQDGAIRIATNGDGKYDIQTQWIREIDYYGKPSADGHYTLE